jgi:hypothetical protein
MANELAQILNGEIIDRVMLLHCSFMLALCKTSMEFDSFGCGFRCVLGDFVSDV